MSSFLGECDCGCGATCRSARIIAYAAVPGFIPVDPPLRSEGGIVFGNGTLSQSTRYLIQRIFTGSLDPTSSFPVHYGKQGTDSRQQKRFRRSRWTCVGSGSGRQDASTWSANIDREIIYENDYQTNLPIYELVRYDDSQTNDGETHTQTYTREWALNSAGTVTADSESGTTYPVSCATLDTVFTDDSAITAGFVTGHAKATYTASEDLATLVIDIDITWDGGFETWSLTYQLTLTGAKTFDAAKTDANGLLDDTFNLQQLGTQVITWTSPAGNATLEWGHYGEVFYYGPLPGYAKRLIVRRGPSDNPADPYNLVDTQAMAAFVKDPTVEAVLTNDSGLMFRDFPTGGNINMGLIVMVSRARLNDGGKAIANRRNCAWRWPHYDPVPSIVLEDPYTPEAEDNGTPAPNIDFTTRTGTKTCSPDIALGDFIVRWDALDPAPDPPPDIPEVAVGSSDWGDAWILWRCGHEGPNVTIYSFDYGVCCGWSGSTPPFDADSLEIDADSSRTADETTL